MSEDKWKLYFHRRVFEWISFDEELLALMEATK